MSVVRDMTRRINLSLAACALSLAIAACGGSGSSSPAAHSTSTPAASSAPAASSTPAATTASASSTPRSGHVTVTIRNYMFEPMHLTVTAGTKVSFHNDDAAPHTATAINQSFDTGTIKDGQTRTVTLSKPGRYAYHCLFHAFMTASITVVAKS